MVVELIVDDRQLTIIRIDDYIGVRLRHLNFGQSRQFVLCQPNKISVPIPGTDWDRCSP
jgi:hypothetical protein